MDAMKRTQEIMQNLAGGIDTVLNGAPATNRKPSANPQNGFALLVFPLVPGQPPIANYVSNCDREDMLVAIREFLARMEGRYVENEGGALNG